MFLSGIKETGKLKNSGFLKKKIHVFVCENIIFIYLRIVFNIIKVNKQWNFKT